ncbi:hypothetical protein [Duganella radicis]|uniref:STAS domain-containing protein n=1 Tax=Duganella radicis TaxID=551988 RepID=A0A6L6PJL5_9BURK|nr:hypothetical protein [Duganella radicis]MTV38919.1 hypothetical protein [Duganella radicis]
MEISVSKSIVDGSTVLKSGSGTFCFRRLTPGALLVTITGNDQGQFGTAALDEIRLEILRHGKLELLVDAEHAELVTVEVSQEWTRFFAITREQLKRVSVLTGSKLINLTVAIAQHLSQTGNLIQIYSDRSLFELALAKASTAQVIKNARS